MEESTEATIQFLQSLPDGLTENICYAGYSNVVLEKMSSITDERERIVETLIALCVKKRSKKSNYLNHLFKGV